MNREILAFNYREAKSVVVCGDIHGAFEEMVFKLCVQYGMTDTLLIVAGDCGFGFEKPGYYDQVFIKISRRLAKANNWVVMIRGNHDDPAYFQEQRIHHERFRCIPDYSIVTACGHTILCIGGAISIDRTYRLAVDSRPHSAQTACFWADEMPYYDEEALAEINAKHKVGIVVTHTSLHSANCSRKMGLWAGPRGTRLCWRIVSEKGQSWIGSLTHCSRLDSLSPTGFTVTSTRVGLRPFMEFSSQCLTLWSSRKY